jgi:hypothetical protein
MAGEMAVRRNRLKNKTIEPGPGFGGPVHGAAAAPGSAKEEDPAGGRGLHRLRGARDYFTASS